MAEEKGLVEKDSYEEKKADAFIGMKNRIDSFNEKTFTLIEDFVLQDYKEHLAKLILYLPAERRKKTVSGLPEPLQSEICKILETNSRKTNCDADVISAAGYVLKNAGLYGEKSVREIIGDDVIYSTEFIKKHGENIFKINPLLEMDLEYYFYADMSILLELDDRDVQKWLREVDQPDLAVAIKDCSEEIQEKVFANMSQRAGDMLKEDMECMGPLRESDVHAKQKELFDILKRLNDSGVIHFPLLDTAI